MTFRLNRATEGAGLDLQPAFVEVPVTEIRSPGATGTTHAGLGDFGDNGGPTSTWSFEAGSPAINLAGSARRRTSAALRDLPLIATPARSRDLL